MKIIQSLTAAFLTLLLPLASNAGMNNRFGFKFHAEADGTFRPTLERVYITAVHPRSPAAAAGLAIGDFIVEANGIEIEGAPVERTTRMIGNTEPGGHLALKVRRGNGLVFHVDLVD